ncbi:hypothetical protein PAXRUDRAFT_828434 [Paxillus rubicundulus Ve08.2h10]|uniref:WW domain-containing protein n=1 Tax=Paxillus rubicundulus Ve08.2h10 TaxID=930991 RepID=A0A0D0DW58_9AGAM|nr:hypothetical protein PAXRUDRAFT_828434 [Paxillus rubicundulus Ve08.2h10]
MSNLPLPSGWIRQYDPNQMHHYWVDTKAIPPRTIWTHPHEDGQFLDEHPEVKAKVDSLSGSNLTEPPPYDPGSWGGGESSSSDFHDHHHTTSSDSDHTGDSSTDKKRGLFGRLKDKAIGTKEEREEHKRTKAEEAARMEEQMRQERMRNLEERAAYMQLHGGYAPYHPSYGGYSRHSPVNIYTPPGGAPRSRVGGGSGLLLGGLAGGLLLGDMLSGGF